MGTLVVKILLTLSYAILLKSGLSRLINYLLTIIGDLGGLNGPNWQINTLLANLRGLISMLL